MAHTTRKRISKRARPHVLESMFATRPPCILIAEDDDDIRTLISVALRKDGYDVVEAKSGAELLEHIGSSMLFGETCPPPDVIVSDVRMPGFTGLEVLAGLRDANWHTPILLITAYGNEDTYEEAERLGASGVFDKPFDIDDLRTAILNLVPADAWARGIDRSLGGWHN